MPDSFPNLPFTSFDAKGGKQGVTTGVRQAVAVLMLFTIGYAYEKVDRIGQISNWELNLWLRLEVHDKQKPAKLCINFALYIKLVFTGTSRFCSKKRLKCNENLEQNMNATVTTLAKQASALSAAERVALAEVLLESVQGESSPEIEQAWQDEIKRRVAEVEAGTATLVSSEDVYAKARQLLR